MTSIKVGVVDDHPLFREGVTRSLSEVSDFVVVGEGANTSDAAMIAADTRPDVLLLDVSMPGDGLSVIDEILSISPDTKILMLTASRGSRYARRSAATRGKGLHSQGCWFPRSGGSDPHCFQGSPLRLTGDVGQSHGIFIERAGIGQGRAYPSGTRGDGSRCAGPFKQAHRPASRSTGENGKASHDPDPDKARRHEQDRSRVAVARKTLAQETRQSRAVSRCRPPVDDRAASRVLHDVTSSTKGLGYSIRMPDIDRAVSIFGCPFS